MGSREAIREIFPPLTSNVIGNDDVLDPSFDVVRNGGCKSVVNIGIPECSG